MGAGHPAYLARPNEHSSHCTPTPWGGGIGILAALVFSAMASGMSMAFWLLIGALAILAFWGGRIELSAKLRLYAQLFLIGLLVVGTGQAPRKIAALIHDKMHFIAKVPAFAPADPIRLGVWTISLNQENPHRFSNLLSKI